MQALLVVDVQCDFCAGGALAVPDGDAVVPVINALMERAEVVVLTQDWHPADHQSFASAHGGRQPYEHIELSYGTQVLWPDHCVQGTPGAAFHAALQGDRGQAVIRKGFRRAIDSYSAFYENDQQTPTGLAGYLRGRGVTQLAVCGLATDFCVKWSVLDGLREGFGVQVIRDAVRAIDLEGSEARAWEEMQAAGAEVIDAAAWPARG
jgi:nicotinamidase/pyrazinamidase